MMRNARRSEREAKERSAASGQLPCRNLLVGVTGSVGVVHLPQYIQAFRQVLAQDVRVLMSRSAQQFIPPYTLQLYSDHWVFTDSFEIADGVKVPHIQLPRQADLFVILPASANIIGKVAHGIADDLITTTVLACEAPIVFVPSMNEVMWRNKAVQGNVRKLKAFGYHVLPPEEGFEIADMKPVLGGMPPVTKLVAQLLQILKRSP